MEIYRLSDLRQILSSRGLSTKGRKEELIERIRQDDLLIDDDLLLDDRRGEGEMEEREIETVEDIVSIEALPPLPPVAEDIFSQKTVPDEMEVKDEYEEDLEDMTINQLEEFFLGLGIPTENLVTKQDYIDRYFEMMATLAPIGTSPVRVHVLSPPLDS